MTTLEGQSILPLQNNSLRPFHVFIKQLTAFYELACSPCIVPDITGHQLFYDRSPQLQKACSYYSAVPAVVGTASSSDMTGFEASGGCCGQSGLNYLIYISLIIHHPLQCKCCSTTYISIKRITSKELHQQKYTNFALLH